MPKGSYITPEILHDAPLEAGDGFDFHFDDYAVTIARLVASKNTKTPLAICVSGDWGSGKTTLMQRIKSMLDQTVVFRKRNDPELLEFANPDEMPRQVYRFCRTVWFNAWKYSDEDELLIALIRRILQEMSDDTVVTKVLGKLLDPTYPRRDVVNTVLSWFKISVSDMEVGLNTGEPIPTQIAEKTAVLDLFDEAFNRLMAAWVHGKVNVKETNPKEGVLVVFIDDLDRCLPAKMVQVLEAVKLFLDKKGCIFILGADVAIVQQAIWKKYQDAGVAGDSSKDYLDKIIQLRFELPPIVEKSMENYLTKMGAIEKDWGESWKLLITGANMNPRSVKAFVNDINLQWSMLVNLIGETKEINRADFNAWQVLMRISPYAFVKHMRFFLYDSSRRHEYVLNAIRWARGDKSRIDDYQAYQDDNRLIRVLQEISFSTSFSPRVLDAFLHLIAPALMPEFRQSQETRPISANRIQVFASYSVEDKDVVHNLVGKLRMDGADIWLDTENWVEDESWDEKMENAMQNSTCILVFISNASKKVGYWNKQLKIAADLEMEKPEGTIFIIPVRLENCELPYSLRKLQWLDYWENSKEKSYLRLIKALNVRAEQKGLEQLVVQSVTIPNDSKSGLDLKD